ncbi:hypothetical protein LguiB_019873 [Lonicera macranthoides]
MASINQTPAKQLGEILQDQQEPFTLQLYLIERGHKDSSNFLNKPVSATNKKGLIIPTCTKILRAVFSKLPSINLRIKNPNSKNQDTGIPEVGKGRHDHADERCSSASSITVFQSCSQSDIEDEHILLRKGQVSASTKAFLKHRNLSIKGEVPKFEYLLLNVRFYGNLINYNRSTLSEQDIRDRNFPWTYEQENKQHSPVSVLEVAALSDERSPVHKMQQNVNKRQEAASIITTKRCTDDSISVASQCKLLDIPLIEKKNQTDAGEMHESISSDLSLQYKRIKMARQQTKQILFDCIREVEGSKDKREQQQFQEFVGPQNLGKLLCENIWVWSRQSIEGTNSTQKLLGENIWAWSRQSVEGTNSTQLLNLEERTGFEQQKMVIGMEIGEFILDDITNVIVAEMWLEGFTNNLSQ